MSAGPRGLPRALAAWLVAAGVACAAATTCAAHESESPGLAAAPCRVPGIRTDVRCGVLRRPLDPARAESIGIDIHYLVVPALARNKLPDPVLLLAGGPGQSAVALAPHAMALFSRLNNRRDIVFIDQRGTGRSASLACEDAETEPIGDELDTARQTALALQCRDALAGLAHVGGVGGLRFFTTTLAVQDFDAVRRQLGAERVNLVGGSYGTRVALEWMRQAPANVRRAVLDGVAPADMALPASMSTDSQAAFDALFAACAAEVACARSHPDLPSRWRSLLATLPREVRMADPLSGRPVSVVLTRDALLGLIRGPLYSPALAAALPAALAAAAEGRFEALAGLHAMQTTRRALRPSIGMHFSVVCAEDVPRLGPPAAGGRDFGNAADDLYRRVCAQWPRGEVADAFYRLPAATSAVLLLSGTLDPVTPPRHGERVAKALGPLARHLTVANAGHGILGIGCARDVVQRFIEADDDRSALAVDASCLASLPRPPFFDLPSGTADAPSPLPR